MNSNIIFDIIRLRSAVSFLGEKKDWWKTNFYGSSSKDLLAYVFPKSLNAPYFSSSISTRNQIDNEVGANYYHLFRLPMSIEELIRNEANVFEIQSFKTEEEALQILKGKAAGHSTDGKEGPKYIGSADHLNQDIIQVFSIEYLSAFQNNYKVHPYLN